MRFCAQYQTSKVNAAFLPPSTQSPTLTPPTPAPMTAAFDPHRWCTAAASSCMRATCPTVGVGMQSRCSCTRTAHGAGSGSARPRCACSVASSAGRKSADACGGEGGPCGPPSITVTLVKASRGSGVGDKSTSCAESAHESKTVPRIPSVEEGR